MNLPCELLGFAHTVQDGDGISVRLDDGCGVLSSSPAGGYRRVGSIGIGVGGDVSLPAPAKGCTAVSSEIVSGKTSAAAIAVADLGSGIIRAGHRGLDGGGVTLLVMLGCDTPVSTLARAAVTANEAVTCVIQDLGLRDQCGRAGSGVSNLSIAVVHDTSSDLFLRGAGKHNRLGELIGRTVYDAVRGSAEANGLTQESVSNLMYRLRVRGYDENRLFTESGSSDRESFEANLRSLCEDEEVLALSASVMQLDDEMSWGLLPREAAIATASEILSILGDGVCTQGSTPMSMLASAVSSIASDISGRRAGHRLRPFQIVR